MVYVSKQHRLDICWSAFAAMQAFRVGRDDVRYGREAVTQSTRRK